ncbi:MAG TPA: DedA family protein [Ktedonobacteraceae bacterium]|nr:DedA family protein [Ktedonobacteraceae bacterium]
MSNLLPYLLTWLQEYGYPILWLSIFLGALGIPLPNTLVLLAAGAFAALGDFNIAWLGGISLSAFVAGDNGSYWIGRLWGSRVLAWLEKTGYVIKPRTIARSRSYFHRLGGWAIFFSRFLLSVLGGAINLLAGAELYPYRRFLLYDLAGETLGALLPLTLGYIFGASWDAVGDILGSFSLFFLALIVVLTLGYQTWRLFRYMSGSAQARKKLEGCAPGDKKSLEAGVAPPDLPRSNRSSAPHSDLPL